MYQAGSAFGLGSNSMLQQRVFVNQQPLNMPKWDSTPRNPTLSPSSSMARVDLSDGLSTKSVQVVSSKNSERGTHSEQLKILAEQLNLVINHNCKLEKDLNYYASFGNQNQQLKKMIDEKDNLVIKLQAEILNKQQSYQDSQESFRQQSNKTLSQDQQLQQSLQQNTRSQQQISELQGIVAAQKNQISFLNQEFKDYESNNSKKIIILLDENEKLSTILENNGKQLEYYQKSFRSGHNEQEENGRLRQQIKDLQQQVSEQTYQTTQFNYVIQNLQNVVSDLTTKVQILCDENDRMAKEIDCQRQGPIQESQEEYEQHQL